MENKAEMIDKLCSEITKATCNMLSALQKALKESGEREMDYHGDERHEPVPLEVVGDDGEYVAHYNISKIRYNDSIEIFDEDEEWLPLAELDTDTIIELISYIVW